MAAHWEPFDKQLSVIYSSSFCVGLLMGFYLKEKGTILFYYLNMGQGNNTDHACGSMRLNRATRHKTVYVIVILLLLKGIVRHSVSKKQLCFELVIPFVAKCNNKILPLDSNNAKRDISVSNELTISWFSTMLGLGLIPWFNLKIRWCFRFKLGWKIELWKIKFI